MNWENWDRLKGILSKMRAEEWGYENFVCETRCCAWGAYVLDGLSAKVRTHFAFLQRQFGIAERLGLSDGAATLEVMAAEFGITVDEADYIFFNLDEGIGTEQELVTVADVLAAMERVEKRYARAAPPIVRE